MQLPGSPHRRRPVLSLKMENRWAVPTLTGICMQIPVNPSRCLRKTSSLMLGAASKTCPFSAALRTNMDNRESQGPAWLTFNFQEHFKAGETFPLHFVLDFQPRLRLSKPFPRRQKVPVNQQCGSTVRVRPGATDQPNLFS